MFADIESLFWLSYWIANTWVEKTEAVESGTANRIDFESMFVADRDIMIRTLSYTRPHLEELCDDPELIKPLAEIQRTLIQLYLRAEQLDSVGMLPQLDEILAEAHRRVIPLFTSLASASKSSKVYYYAMVPAASAGQ